MFNLQSIISQASLQSRLNNGFKFAYAGRHFIKPCAILTVILLAYTVEFLLLSTEKLHKASVWAVDTLIVNAIDYSALPQEDTLLDDTVAKLRDMTIRELKKVASMQKLPRYGSLTKPELVEALIEQGRKEREV